MTKEDILNKLKEVIDPELGVNIVDLGLVYNVSVSGSDVKVLMTLTSPGCPLAAVIDGKVREKNRRIKRG